MRAGMLCRRALILGAALMALALRTAADDVESADVPRSFAYLPVPGPYEVQEIGTLTLPDPPRWKRLPVMVYAPAEPGPFPVVLFSHGAGQSAESASSLARHWTSHGYVCLHPGHLQEEVPARPFAVRRLTRDFGRIRNLGGAHAFGQRVDDLVLILDHLDDLVEQAPALRGKMDPERVGVAGHSLGAVTAVLIGGATVFPPEKSEPVNMRDERVGAIVNISGAGVDPETGLTRRSWEDIDIPMLTIAGSRDPGRGDVRWRTHAYKYATPGGKYLLYIEGANHVSYIRFGEARTYTKEQVGRPKDLPAHWRFLRRNAPSLAQRAIYHYTLMATTAFWDAYLKDSAEAREFLTSDAIEEYSFGKATIEAK